MQAVVAESEETSVFLEEAVGELDADLHTWLTEHAFALINYEAMKAFVEGNGQNEIERVWMLARELEDNDVYIEFTERHFVKWCEAELELRAA